ncbi:MAG: hypothetical protein ALECFALPRED_004186 [Alectoria fallacina]|uniref:Uncharacterized protein n=1 Tax=Alectoria fallacina TaxID=1903189 RepID=A0A8H3FTE1_9LECA|nr:MAG: hypothetical protein ALECFALPRED_004186 [Alectoria fallacina]
MHTPTSNLLTPYPTAPQIEDIFLLHSKRDNEGNVVRQHDFNSHLADDIEVVVTSKEDHLSGTYTGKDAFNKEDGDPTLMSAAMPVVFVCKTNY